MRRAHITPKHTSSARLNLIYDLIFPKALNLSTLDSLVIDEADLILSYGHDQDMRSILSADNTYLPSIFQSFLMSATMTKDVEALKGLVLRSPVILRLEEDEDEARNLVQYTVRYGYDVFQNLPASCPRHLAMGGCLSPHRQAPAHIKGRPLARSRV
jgi:superfamily II DNA/RNA helicase